MTTFVCRPTVWCIVANIVHERNYGPDGLEKRPGTKHFAPGTKVYSVRFFWGMGGESVEVVGRHRASQRYIKIIIRSAWLANYRVKLAHSPTVIRHLVGETAGSTSDDQGRLPRREGEFVHGLHWDNSEAARQKCEEIVAMWNSHGAKTQPFVTRPPTDP